MKRKFNKHEDFLALAVDLAIENVENEGGPFGAVIVRNGEIVASASNRVTDKNDPTAHAEMEAIRQAASKLGDFHLKDCIIYSSCEPCPMCMGAIYWAGLDALYFASNRLDAEKAGFSDAHIYSELTKSLEDRSIPSINLRTDNAGEEFRVWDEKEGKIKY